MKDKIPLLRLLFYAAPYKRRFFCAVFFMLVASAMNVLPPWLFKSVVDDVLIKKDTAVLNLVCVSVVIIFVLKGAAVYGQQYYMNWVGQRVVMDIRIILYDHMQRMSFRHIHASRVGELMSRITSDVATLQGLVTSTFVNLVLNGVTFLGMLGFILYINWRLSLITLTVLPVVAWLLTFAARSLRRAGHSVQERLANLTAIVQEAFSALRVVRAFATEELELERFRRGNIENFDALLRAVRIQALLAGIIEVFLIVALAAVFWSGGREVLNDKLSPGELVAFIGYIAFMVQPIRVFMNSMNTLQTGFAALDRIFSILETPTETEENDGGKEREKRSEKLVIGRISGRVAFENVRFSYADGQEILRGVDFEAKEGEKIAIVGPTGGGKSTLVDLIPRFYAPSSGRVLIDGHDAAALSLPELRRQIGIVPQESVLMKGTFAFNISYGLPNASMEDIRTAAKIADIDDFIMSLPDGYGAEIGERGVTLSGGQRQRVAIARAVVRDPRILILDEATSSLDAEVERQVQKAMDRAMAGRTSFVIAHRLSTVRNADTILILDAGRIAQRGTHEELLRLDGVYSRLYNLQFGTV